MDRGAWWATVHGVTELDMTEQLRVSLFTRPLHLRAQAGEELSHL